MKKKTSLAAFMTMLMLATILSAISTNATENAGTDDVSSCDIVGIWGYVYDKNTGDPIEGVKVKAYCLYEVYGVRIPYSLTDTTDSGGYYNLYATQRDTWYVIKASKFGYLPVTKKEFFPDGQYALHVDFNLKSIFPSPAPSQNAQSEITEDNSDTETLGTKESPLYTIRTLKATYKETKAPTLYYIFTDRIDILSTFKSKLFSNEVSNPVTWYKSSATNGCKPTECGKTCDFGLLCDVPSVNDCPSIIRFWCWD